MGIRYVAAAIARRADRFRQAVAPFDHHRVRTRTRRGDCRGKARGPAPDDGEIDAFCRRSSHGAHISTKII
jgi:hypothetical protein